MSSTRVPPFTRDSFGLDMMAEPDLNTYLPFYFTYKHIMAGSNNTARPRYYRRTSLSCPPMVADAYRFTPSTELYRWTPGVLQHPDQDTAQNLSTHRTSSIFWCRDHQTFLTVPYDCTVVNVADMAAVDELDNWERLKFFHETLGFYSENRAVSVVGHRYPEDKLAATGPTRWVPQLIPDAHQRNGDPAQLGINGTSLLAGDLSILLGLAALSTTPSTVPLTIQECFRPHPLNSNWVTHDRQSFGRQPDRGIVMTIKYDSRFVTEESLKDWESGISSKGPILV